MGDGGRGPEMELLVSSLALDLVCEVFPTQKGLEKDFSSYTVMWLMAAVPSGSLNKV